MHLGLIGKSLGHSFSYRYFAEKFQSEGLFDYHYRNYELNDISEFPRLLDEHPDLAGLNVTVPYKGLVMPYLDNIDSVASEIGAVNVISIINGKTSGYNTDYLGFKESLAPLLKSSDTRALILGTGGASRAVSFALNQLNIRHLSASRNPGGSAISYADAGVRLDEFDIVINCTPVGTYPHTSEMPPLPMGNVSENHLFYDLIYNPEKSLWLREAEEHGARVKNGYEMLVLQAEAAWKLWHED